MKKHLTKALAVLTVLVMIISLMPVAAFAGIEGEPQGTWALTCGHGDETCTAETCDKWVPEVPVVEA